MKLVLPIDRIPVLSNGFTLQERENGHEVLKMNFLSDLRLDGVDPGNISNRFFGIEFSQVIETGNRTISEQAGKVSLCRKNIFKNKNISHSNLGSLKTALNHHGNSFFLQKNLPDFAQKNIKGLINEFFILKTDNFFDIISNSMTLATS